MWAVCAWCPAARRLDSSAKDIYIYVEDAGCAAALAAGDKSVHCEVIGLRNQFLEHFLDGLLVPVPPVESAVTNFDAGTNIVTVSVKRGLPLSSSHGGQPLRLAFHLPAGVVAVSEPFTVLAKQGKSGSSRKQLKAKPQPPLTSDRVQARSAIAATLGVAAAEVPSAAVPVPVAVPKAASTRVAVSMAPPPLKAAPPVPSRTQPPRATAAAVPLVTSTLKRARSSDSTSVLPVSSPGLPQHALDVMPLPSMTSVLSPWVGDPSFTALSRFNSGDLIPADSFGGFGAADFNKGTEFPSFDSLAPPSGALQRQESFGLGVSATPLTLSLLADAAQRESSKDSTASDRDGAAVAGRVARKKAKNSITV